MKLSCLRFQWSFLFAEEISRWVTSALPRPDFSETPKDGTLSWIPTAVFFARMGSGQVHLIFRKNIFSPFFEHHFHPFSSGFVEHSYHSDDVSVVLVRFPLHLWPRLSGLITLSDPFGRCWSVLLPVHRRRSARLELRWWGPKGLWCLLIFRTISGYSLV
jgi:hypothetical protein